MREINKHTLIEALASLPIHSPPDKVWNSIEKELVLQKGLSELEEYNPPNAIWDAIQNDLVLQRGVTELPAYEPPSTVWKNISTQLQADKPQEKGRVVSMQRFVRLAVAAAVVGLMAFFGWQQIGSNATAGEEFTYSTETVDEFRIKKDWNEDEDAFEYLLNICKERVLACENPEFKSLKMELEELNDAKAMLEEAIGPNGTDANLIAQMKKIEFERTDIVKKMIENVI